MQGTSDLNTQVHDKVSAPPHNYIATYFWLEEQFKANALIHFGTHGSEFFLPGKSDGLSQRDWPDIIMGGDAELQSVDHRKHGRVVAGASPHVRRVD